MQNRMLMLSVLLLLPSPGCAPLPEGDEPGGGVRRKPPPRRPTPPRRRSPSPLGITGGPVTPAQAVAHAARYTNQHTLAGAMQVTRMAPPAQQWYRVTGGQYPVYVATRRARAKEPCAAAVPPSTRQRYKVGTIPCEAGLMCCYDPPGANPGSFALHTGYRTCLTKKACGMLLPRP